MGSTNDPHRRVYRGVEITLGIPNNLDMTQRDRVWAERYRALVIPMLKEDAFEFAPNTVQPLVPLPEFQITEISVSSSSSSISLAKEKATAKKLAKMEKSAQKWQNKRK